jgi:hypothetical protein
LTFAAGLTDYVFAADAREGEILAKRETTVAYFLLTPHRRMPDMNLSRNEVADLTAYIKP